MTTNTGSLPIAFFPSGQLGLLNGGSDAGRLSFANANVGNTSYTATFQAATGTVALLGIAQSWTAAQTFTYGDLVLLQTSGGGLTTLEPAGTGSSNYTQTLPAYTGGVVVDSTTSPSTGDVLYYTSAGKWASLGIGSSGYTLQVSSGLPAWVNAATGGVASVTAGNSSLTISPTTGAVSASLGELDSGGTLGGYTFAASGVAKGGLLYATGSYTWAPLAIGSPGYFLTVSSGLPAWTSLSIPPAQLQPVEQNTTATAPTTYVNGIGAGIGSVALNTTPTTILTVATPALGLWRVTVTVSNNSATSPVYLDNISLFYQDQNCLANSATPMQFLAIGVPIASYSASTWVAMANVQIGTALTLKANASTVPSVLMCDATFEAM